MDLSGLIKQNSYDLSRINEKPLNAVRNYGVNGKLFALPFSDKYAALFYNKDIFDKFAVPYPKDHMSREEIIALGKRVARMDGGVQYKALKEKNVKGIFTNDYAEPSSFSKYDSIVRGFINKAIKEVGTGQSDVNTALRRAEELANQAIAEKKS